MSIGNHKFENVYDAVLSASEQAELISELQERIEQLETELKRKNEALRSIGRIAENCADDELSGVHHIFIQIADKAREGMK